MAESAKPSPPEVKIPKPNLPDVWDLAKLEASVNSTSQRAVTQWLAYLSLWAYLFFTTLSITHRDLILLTPVKLPLIGVELGLREYFWAGPPLFWVFHLYLVRKITVLARDVAFYRAVMKRIVSSSAAREPLYRRLDAFFLTRLLGYREQGRLLRWLDGAIALATVVLMPLALMIAFQVEYLAFHDVWATDWHRGWLLADVFLVVLLLWQFRRRWRFTMTLRSIVARLMSYIAIFGQIAMAILVLGGCIGFSLFVATFPDDRMDNFILTTILRNQIFFWLEIPRNLAPSDTDFVNDEKLDKVEWTIDLRNRDFRRANLKGADLRKARMSGIDLTGADLSGSNMNGADISESLLILANISHSQLKGINLRNSVLLNSTILHSNLQGSNISESYIVGANLSSSQFQGADVSRSILQGALIRNSQLQGVDLRQSDLSGADISNSQLQGADIRGADSDGSFYVTTHKFYNLTRQKKENLEFRLDENTKFTGAKIDGVNFWRVKSNINTDFGMISPKSAVVFNQNYEINNSSIDSWISSVPSGKNRDAMERRLVVLRENGGGNEGEKYVRRYFEKNLKN